MENTIAQYRSDIVSSHFQVDVCNTEACHTYSWKQTDWSACSVDVTRECGVGVKWRRNVCVRNDDVEADVALCSQLDDEGMTSRTHSPLA